MRREVGAAREGGRGVYIPLQNANRVATYRKNLVPFGPVRRFERNRAQAVAVVAYIHRGDATRRMWIRRLLSPEPPGTWSLPGERAARTPDSACRRSTRVAGPVAESRSTAQRQAD